MYSTNLPNEKIPLDTLNFIPIWLKGKFNTLIHSSGLCEQLLPKFLSENPTVDDIQKAELILKHLFTIEKLEIPKENLLSHDFESYYSKVHLEYLMSALIGQKLTARIVSYCSDNIIIDLAEKIKDLGNLEEINLSD